MGSFTLNEAGDNLSGSFVGFSVGANNPLNHCFQISPQLLFGGTFSAVAQKNTNGDIFSMTDLALVPTVDGTAFGLVVCKDLEIDVGGPIEGRFFDVFGLDLLTQCGAAGFTSVFYTGFQLFKLN